MVESSAIALVDLGSFSKSLAQGCILDMINWLSGLCSFRCSLEKCTTLLAAQAVNPLVSKLDILNQSEVVNPEDELLICVALDIL